jgi:transposase
MKKVSRMKHGVEERAVVAVGLDVGDRWSHWCSLSGDGEVAGRGRVASTAEALAEQAKVWSGVRVALENGAHSGWMSRVLETSGCSVVVANPSRWRGTAHNSKNDRNDAEALARTVRVDPRLLFPIQHRPEQSQQDLAVIRVRAQLVKTRTLLVNTARGTVKSLGHRLPSGSADYFVSTTWKHVPEPLRPALAPLYRTLGEINLQIAELDRRIVQLSAQRYPETRRLTSVPGIGKLTALTYVLTVGGKDRFASSREAGAYLGLRPKQRQSGERDPELGIAKNGDSYLRSLLVECAHHVLSRGPDSALKRWGLALSTGGTRARKRALVAVARKLAVLLHRLWTTGEDFRAFPNPQPLEETVDAEKRAHRSLQPTATAA